MRSQVGRRPGDRDSEGRAHGYGDHVHLQLLEEPHSQVEALFDDVDVPVLNAQLDLDARMLLGQASDGGPDQRVRGVLPAGHP